MKLGLSITVLLAIPSITFAYADAAPRPGELWSRWEFNPGVVAALAISLALYAAGSRKHFGLTRLQKTCFWAGWASLVIALISPLHPLGEALFSAHMVQHEILMLISAPLLVLSRPIVTFCGHFL